MTAPAHLPFTLPLDFEVLGRVVTTPAALKTDVDLSRLLDRHRSGDWGDLPPEDRDENNLVIGRQVEGRLFSMYNAAGTSFYIITYPFDHTSITLAEEY